MSSPFKTPQEFLAAKGPIYSFSSSPVIIGLFILISAAISLWFIYASYTIKTTKSEEKNTAVLSILLAISALSLADVLYKPDVEKTKATPTQKAVVAERVSNVKRGQRWQVPTALLGMTLTGGTLPRSLRTKARRSIKRQSGLSRLIHPLARVLSRQQRSSPAVRYRSKRQSW